MSEHDEQAALIDWCNRYKAQIPELEFIFAIPSGQLRPQKRNRNGKWYSPVGKKLKASGVKRGIPDLCLPFPSRGYHGLWLEMKFGKNKPTKEQLWWIAKLKEQGYFVVVPYSMEAAALWILQYLNVPTPERFMPYGWQDKVTATELWKEFNGGQDVS